MVREGKKRAIKKARNRKRKVGVLRVAVSLPEHTHGGVEKSVRRTATRVHAPNFFKMSCVLVVNTRDATTIEMFEKSKVAQVSTSTLISLIINKWRYK